MIESAENESANMCDSKVIHWGTDRVAALTEEERKELNFYLPKSAASTSRE